MLAKSGKGCTFAILSESKRGQNEKEIKKYFRKVLQGRKKVLPLHSQTTRGVEKREKQAGKKEEEE